MKHNSALYGQVKDTLPTRAWKTTAWKELQTEVLRNAHLASLGEMTAGLAHEIINPINGIINYAQILADRCNRESEDAVFLNRIIQEGDRIATLLNELLTYARECTGRKEPVALQTILDNSLTLFRPLLRKDAISVTYTMPDEALLLNADRQQIQQVFYAILSNARYSLNMKFPHQSHEKAIAITGNLITEKKPIVIRTCIRDQGLGIHGDFHNNACEPFLSTSPPGEGVGLGLHISKEIIFDHGGEIRFESTPGEYTSVIVDLPAYAQDTAR